MIYFIMIPLDHSNGFSLNSAFIQKNLSLPLSLSDYA